MGLLTEVTKKIFDLNEICRGDLVHARHKSWQEGRSGFVVGISDNEMTIQYFPDVGTITNHYVIRAEEVETGSWDLRWSKDLKEVYGVLAKESGESL